MTVLGCTLTNMLVSWFLIYLNSEPYLYYYIGWYAEPLIGLDLIGLDLIVSVLICLDLIGLDLIVSVLIGLDLIGLDLIVSVLIGLVLIGLVLIGLVLMGYLFVIPALFLNIVVSCCVCLNFTQTKKSEERRKQNQDGTGIAKEIAFAGGRT